MSFYSPMQDLFCMVHTLTTISCYKYAAGHQNPLTGTNKLAPLVDKQPNMEVDAHVTDHLSQSTVSYIGSHSSSVTKFKIWYILAIFLCHRIKSQTSYFAHPIHPLALPGSMQTKWYYTVTFSNILYFDHGYIYSDSQQMRDNVYAVHILWRAPVYIVEFRNCSTFFLFLSLWKCEEKKV